MVNIINKKISQKNIIKIKYSRRYQNETRIYQKRRYKRNYIIN